MIVDIPSVISVQPAPAPQVQGASGQPSAPDDSSAGAWQTAPSQGQGADSSNAGGGNVSGNGIGGGSPGGDSHFGRLLAAQGQNGNQPGTKSVNPTASAPSGGNAPTSSTPAMPSSGTTTGNVVAAQIAVLLSQLQTAEGADVSASQTQDQPLVSVTGDVGNAPVPASVSSSSGSGDALQQLQRLVQQLLQLAEQGNEVTANSNSASSGSGSATLSPQVKTAKTSGTDGDITQVFVQLAALVQQITQQANSASVAVSDDATGDVAISSDGSGNSATALLAQLASLLGQKSPTNVAGTGNAAAGDAVGASGAANTADVSGGAGAANVANISDIGGPAGADDKNTAAGNSSGFGNSGKNAANASSSFDATLSALLQSPDTRNSLQSALSQINNFIAVTQNPKTGTAGTDKDENVTATSSASPTPATQLLVPATSNPQPVNDSGFAKLVSASQQPPSVADQVLVQIKSAADNGSSQIKIQLEPADLGKVTVQMNTGTDGKTGVTVTADNRQTLSLLQSEARSLESALRDIGLKTGTGGLSFNLSGQQSQQQNSGQQGGYTQVAAVSMDDGSDYYSTASQIYQFAAQQGLDIRV